MSKQPAVHLQIALSGFARLPASFVQILVRFTQRQLQDVSVAFSSLGTRNMKVSGIKLGTPLYAVAPVQPEWIAA
jgi:hypothetical protein